MMESPPRKKVMIVDDSEIVLTVAQRALESAGYAVVTHPRPAGCIALILQELPDLLLIDVNMPGLNGDTVVKMLGSTQSDAEMIVLLYSSLKDEVLAQKAKASRAHGYIRKSESPQDLVRQVSRWLRPGHSSGKLRLGSGTLDIARHVSEPRIAVSDYVSEPRIAVSDYVSEPRVAVSGYASEPRVAVSGYASEPRVAVSGRVMSSDSSSGRILLVDHEMVELSELRRLVVSLPGPVEFALSGKEVLRRLQGESPPDVVVLGKLIESPDGDEVLREASRLSPRWKSRFIIVHDSAIDVRLNAYVVTRLRRPVTEVALRGAIDNCLQRAS